jgi:putative tryptophan/tyrosine transport system substrate-binding protein
MALVAGGLAAGPLVARAQSPSAQVIGLLHTASAEPFQRLVAAFREGLGQSGYVEGRNLKIEYRWAEGDEDRLKTYAADLVKRNVALIAALGGVRAAQVAEAATDRIPILFISGFDPVQLGFVKSINAPGVNATGVNLESTEMIAKRYEMLRQLVAPGTKVAMLVSSYSAIDKIETEFVEQSGLIRIKLEAGKESDEAEYESKFAAAVQDGAGGLLVSSDPLFTNARELIINLAAKRKLPAIYPWRQYATAGGLASYGPNIAEAYRQIGRYAARILKGARPETLPVETPNVFELVINLRTAKALSLDVSPWLLAAANEIIE